jgi:hypothetical protein
MTSPRHTHAKGPGRPVAAFLPAGGTKWPGDPWAPVLCPRCKADVKGAVRAVTGYVLIVPCGCQGASQEFVDAYERCQKRERRR